MSVSFLGGQRANHENVACRITQRVESVVPYEIRVLAERKRLTTVREGKFSTYPLWVFKRVQTD